jgi:hypothetical protein
MDLGKKLAVAPTNSTSLPARPKDGAFSACRQYGTNTRRSLQIKLHMREPRRKEAQYVSNWAENDHYEGEKGWTAPLRHKCARATILCVDRMLG